MTYKKKQCGKRHPYCAECKPEHPNVGSLSAEHRASISAGMKKIHSVLSISAKARWNRGDFNHRSGPTRLEHALSLLLQSAELPFEFHKDINGYEVDFWVPARGLVFEADGQYWHAGRVDERHGYNSRRVEPEKRDAVILAHDNVVAVIHLTEKDLDNWLVKGGQ